MGNLAFLFLIAIAVGIGIEGNGAFASEFKVGGLDAWGVPPDGKTDLYKQWLAQNKIKVGDSLLFLYPPSEDSVIQVTEEAYVKCNISNPIATFNDGNSVFRFNNSGYFYFTSGMPGHCEKSQKLAVPVLGANGALPPASGPTLGLFTGPGLSPLSSAMPINFATMVHPAHSLSLMVAIAFGLYMLL